MIPRLRQSSRYALRVVLLLAALIAVGGCTRSSRDLAPGEVDLIAWWVEDVAHERDRSAAELVTPAASAGLARIARWAHGADAQRPELPGVLARRRARWGTLRALIGDGVVTVDRSTGALASTRGDPHLADRALAASLVAEENTDRDSLDLHLLTLAHADDATARRYRRVVRDARVRSDVVALAR